MKKIKKYINNKTALALSLMLSSSYSFAGSSSSDPLSKGLKTLADLLSSNWGVGALFVVFIFAVIMVGVSEDKAKSMKVAGVICVVGVVVVGASKIFEQFNLSGALF